MTAFDAIGIASTGLTVHRKWLDAVSDNIANANTVKSMDDTAFQARYIEVQEGDGTSGVFVKADRYGSEEGRVTYQPDHPWRTPRATCGCPTSTSAPRWAT
nr:hypothetical protein GCM10025699_67820 [Microbacterium flavescens]